MSSLALFDFDGTITRKDSFIEILKFSAGKPSFYFGMTLMMPVLFAYKFKLIPNWRAKEIVFTYFFRNWESSRFQEMCDQFSAQEIPGMVKKDALKRIQEHKEKGHRVMLVSASFENWLRVWCRHHEIELIGSRLEILEERLTGKIEGKNCYGPEKVVRIKKYLDLSDYTEVYAYGDSSGDREMLQLADHAGFRTFKN